MLRRNGYVLEQLLSPLVVHTSEPHRELAALIPGVLTSHHAHHYRGFAQTQWALHGRTGELKPALYTLRVLLTGIHLMRTGEVVADLAALWPDHALPYVPDLIAAKRLGEHAALGSLVDAERLASDVIRLLDTLEAAAQDGPLPAAPSAYDAVHDLVVRARLDGLQGPSSAKPTRAS
jgi:predicted nucleotidyltransferase